MKSVRLLVIQYAGDYKEAERRRLAGEPEFYHAQHDTLRLDAELAREMEEVAVLILMTEKRYNEMTPSGVRVIGAGFSGTIPPLALVSQLRAYAPTRLIVRTPVLSAFVWAILSEVTTLALLANSFYSQGWRRRVRHRLLAFALNHPRVSWVANHNVPASRSLVQMGVSANKVIPYDFADWVSPPDLTPKSYRSDATAIELFYVGSVTHSKGVGDLLAAVATLQTDRVAARLTVVGQGEIETFTRQAQALGITDRVRFVGARPNAEIIPMMRQADIVVVPSRYASPEAMPLPVYEALCSRTPLIVSDHPAMIQRLKHGVDAMIYPAGAAVVLAGCVKQLMTDAVLYHQLSVASAAALQRLQVPVKYKDVVLGWLQDTPAQRRWLYEHSLASGRYDP